MTTPSQPDLAWSRGVPMARAYDDPYFSRRGGLEESRHVFLAGNDLSARLHDGFRVAELGFGTGRNLLALAFLWQQLRRPGRIRYTGFELAPMAAPDMAAALVLFPELASLAEALVSQWREHARKIRLPGVEATIIIGDAHATLPAWRGRADAWFLDGFAPSKNPEMWTDALMAEVARHTAPGGTLATYTAAGHVRRALAARGFEITRTPGFAGKKHMTRGRLVSPSSAPACPEARPPESR